MNIWMYVCTHGCMDVWMHGCMDVWMYGCMDICITNMCMSIVQVGGDRMRAMFSIGREPTLLFVKESGTPPLRFSGRMTQQKMAALFARHQHHWVPRLNEHNVRPLCAAGTLGAQPCIVYLHRGPGAAPTPEVLDPKTHATHTETDTHTHSRTHTHATNTSRTHTHVHTNRCWRRCGTPQPRTSVWGLTQRSHAN